MCVCVLGEGSRWKGLHGKVDQGRCVCVCWEGNEWKGALCVFLCVCVWGRVMNGRGLHGMVVQQKRANELT